MAKPYPKEFRNDVVAVARKGQAPLSQIAKDFGISEGSLANWMKQADVEDGRRPGLTDDERKQLREANKRIRLLEQENEVLRRAAAYLSQANLPKIVFPLVREMAATGAPIRVPVAVACRVLGLSTQGYYKWLKDPVCQRDWDDAHLIDVLYDLHADDATLGYRFLTDELDLEHGITVGENRVHRLCRIAGITASHHKKRSKAGSTGPAPHDDLLAVVDEHGVVRHKFVADEPNKVWLWDISEHPTREGKLYICAIKDVFSNKIVGYSIDTRMKSSLASAAMRNAIALRSPTGTVCHSDRGGQFRAKRTQRLLANNDLVGSMGRSYGAGDNASMESFFSLLQKNVLDTRRWDTREDLRLAIVTWIETKYNRRRRQRALGKLTPVEFEMIYATAEAA
ncbi:MULTISPECIES: IS3 family transposase [Janibacter]|uniref:IS3 family transposase n=1 Tax=Janibacter TaxID=53457 RepID=UPI0021A6FA4A|nr:IS3 family transposase [Janibacter hoylei]MCT1617967.1 IS3 family transposase [Janibacter hoylei]MCT2292066.1 IS3 family transposase [Janibacter hoylei]MCW4601704.1 IS3 family transposase [Janibacter hoylei]MCW4602009.1 IS3 family transposase [Janibacter hoylei]MCW4602948.1 IS3 family transposase [Janibacter hoylei]